MNIQLTILVAHYTIKCPQRLPWKEMFSGLTSKTCDIPKTWHMLIRGLTQICVETVHSDVFWFVFFFTAVGKNNKTSFLASVKDFTTCIS